METVKGKKCNPSNKRIKTQKTSKSSTEVLAQEIQGISSSESLQGLKSSEIIEEQNKPVTNENKDLTENLESSVEKLEDQQNLNSVSREQSTDEILPAESLISLKKATQDESIKCSDSVKFETHTEQDTEFILDISNPDLKFITAAATEVINSIISDAVESLDSAEKPEEKSSHMELESILTKTEENSDSIQAHHLVAEKSISNTLITQTVESLAVNEEPELTTLMWRKIPDYIDLSKIDYPDLDTFEEPNVSEIGKTDTRTILPNEPHVCTH